MSPDYWQEATEQLSAADPVMGGLIARYKGETMQTRGEAFYTLARSIVGQQISVKAADAVWGRFEQRVLAEGPMHPETLPAIVDEELRSCGLSRQKVVYLRAIADHFSSHGVKVGYFDSHSDDEAIAFLCEIKGVGRWTAEMFLMFHLMRPDIFPVDDIGLQKAVEMHYTSGERPSKKQLLALGARWKPWRTVATWYLWRALDPLPVAY